MDHPLFEVVTTTAGARSIRHKLVNEIMHNPVGPWPEANALYIQPSKLAERLSEPHEEALVVWDVGLGAAANAVAALACRRTHPGRRLELISFERELELLQFTLDVADQFDHLRGFEGALRNILERDEHTEDGVRWRLLRGDFFDRLPAAPLKPHVIFYDPYSPKRNEEMWTAKGFALLHERSRTSAEGGTLLMTYSQATRIRAALIAAGFFVGYGQSTGLKEETTQAATDRSLLPHPLGPEWFLRWSRSHIKYPFDCTDEAAVDRALTAYFA